MRSKFTKELLAKQLETNRVVLNRKLKELDIQLPTNMSEAVFNDAKRSLETNQNLMGTNANTEFIEEKNKEILDKLTKKLKKRHKIIIDPKNDNIQEIYAHLCKMYEDNINLLDKIKIELDINIETYTTITQSTQGKYLQTTIMQIEKHLMTLSKSISEVSEILGKLEHDGNAEFDFELH